jgi:hypothetical protein
MGLHRFEYRVVYHEANGFAIYKLSVNEKGEYHFVGNSPYSPWGISLDGLKSNFDELQLAFSKDILNYKNIKII